jgi:hypothetical protein
MSTPREEHAGLPQGSVLSQTLYSIYTSDIPRTSGVYLALFPHIQVYATDRKESYVLRKLQRGLSSIEMWYRYWNIKFNEDRTRIIYFSHPLRPT